MTSFIMNGWFIQHSKICVTSFIVNGRFIQLSKLCMTVFVMNGSSLAVHFKQVAQDAVPDFNSQKVWYQ